MMIEKGSGKPEPFFGNHILAQPNGTDPAQSRFPCTEQMRIPREETNMKKFALIAGTCVALAFAGANVALADDCSGHNHDTGTIVGGVGGAAIGGLASHSIVGAVAGGVIGGLAGNAIDRDQDCAHQAQEERHDEHQAYNNGYADGAADASAPPPPADRDDVTVYREPGDR
jgi:Glycine zipper